MKDVLDLTTNATNQKTIEFIKEVDSDPAVKLGLSKGYKLNDPCTFGIGGRQFTLINNQVGFILPRREEKGYSIAIYGLWIPPEYLVQYVAGVEALLINFREANYFFDEHIEHFRGKKITRERVVKALVARDLAQTCNNLLEEFRDESSITVPDGLNDRLRDLFDTEL